MQCNIEWNTLPLEEWDKFVAQTVKPSLLQSYPYALAMRDAHQQSSRFGLIKINDKPAGLCIIQEVGIFKKAIHAVSLDRGPMWFKGYGQIADWTAFLTQLNKEFPRRFGRKRRLIAELPQKAINQSMLTECGWHINPKSSIYQTIWLGLTADIETLRKNLKQKWRNALNKSEKQGLTIDIDQDGKSLDILLKRYMSDRLQKKYAGASPKMIKSLAKHAAPRGELLILNAIKDQDIIASILVFLHGTSATYQIGWSGQKGRVHNAHYALLWQAICILKQNNITDFDLGGINDDSAAGVKAFKNGLGGQEIALIGQYS